MGDIKIFYLFGTEAPDNNDIPSECDCPNSGYDDRNQGHSVEWNEDFSGFVETEHRELKDRAAKRAQEEYEKAVEAYRDGDLKAAAYFLGVWPIMWEMRLNTGHAVPFEIILLG